MSSLRRTIIIAAVIIIILFLSFFFFFITIFIDIINIIVITIIMRTIVSVAIICNEQELDDANWSLSSLLEDALQRPAVLEKLVLRCLK